MRFSTIFTVLAAGAMAFAGAVPEIVAKRSNTDMKNAFDDLDNKCDTIIPKFSGCKDDTCSALVVAELVVAIKECTTVLGGLSGGLGTITVANAVVGVVTVSVGRLPGSTSLTLPCRKSLPVSTRTRPSVAASAPGLINIYADIDLSLSVCLQTVFNLCTGLVALVTVRWVLDIHLPPVPSLTPLQTRRVVDQFAGYMAQLGHQRLLALSEVPASDLCPQGSKHMSYLISETYKDYVNVITRLNFFCVFVASLSMVVSSPVHENKLPRRVRLDRTRPESFT